MYFFEEAEAAPPPLPDLGLCFLMAPWAMAWVGRYVGIGWRMKILDELCESNLNAKISSI